MEVTDEHVHDGKVLSTLVDDIKKSNEWKADKLLADGAYGSNDTFRCLSDNGYTLYKSQKECEGEKNFSSF